MLFVGFIFECFLLFYIGADIPNRWMKWIYILMGIIFSLSILFKINHWPYGTEGLSVSTTVCLAIAAYYYINKSPKTIQNYLLIGWLFLLALHFNLTDIGLNYKWYINLFASALLWINVIFALVLQFRNTE
jgi:hypothetical protein